MFLIDLRSKDPIFIQIQNQIQKFIRAGVLKPGDKLPSVRQLAQDNGINPNTVARAYSQLEQNGYVTNIPKKGVYVKEMNLDDSLEEMAAMNIRQLKEAGISMHRLLQIVNRVYEEDETNAEN